MIDRKHLSALGLTLVLLAPAAPAADLLEIFQLALQSDPRLREAEANRLAALESKPQARSGYLPQFTADAQFLDQETNGANTFLTLVEDPNTGNEVPVTINTSQESDADTTQWQLQLTQSVFRWDRWVQMQQADKTIGQAEVDYQLERQNLILRVGEAYFDVLAARDTLASEQAAKEAIKRQLEQAQTRFDVGLIAITDVYEAQAAFDQAVAAEIQAKRELATARENLREITGEYSEGLLAPGDELPLVSPDPSSEDSWVETALDNNLSLVSSRFGVEIAKDDIRVQRAGHYPTLDLVASRTRFDRDSTQTNNGVTGPSDVDQFSNTIQLNLSVPVFSGGATSSRVREAVYRHRAAKERLERVARETERLTRDSYLGVISDISRVNALKQALASSETALRATEAGFDVGTRTTVDVLDARRELFRAETNYQRSRYDYILNVLRLKLAAGSLSGDDIIQVNRWLK